MAGSVGGAPLVTVGLPVHNGERFLAGAIRSVLEQDVENLELLISDNASQDGTEEICRSFARSDPRVRYERAERNHGAAWNFSRLPVTARGRYFRWHAHDDECRSGFLRACLEVLERDPGVSLVYPRSTDVDGDDRYLDSEELWGTGTQASPLARARSLLLHPAFPAAAPFGLVRREQLLQTDLLRPYKGSDRTMLLQLALLGRFHEIDEPLFLHRRHAGRSGSLPRAQWLTWWDGGPQGRRVSPRSRLLRGYASGIARSPVPVAVRVGVMGLLPLWALRNASPLTREALAVIAQPLVRRRPASA
ncbi:MAG: glycosyltransferase family 2 protein [Actinomycetes bacterium]